MQTTYLESAQTKPVTLHPDASVTMPKLWDQKTLAAYLGKSTAWCERARWAGDGPRFCKLGRHVRYKADDVLAWIDENARTCSGGRES